jgi:hypothetical protein
MCVRFGCGWDEMGDLMARLLWAQSGGAESARCQAAVFE